MNLEPIMDGIAERLKAVGGLRVSAQPPKTIVPPAAIVSYPKSIDYDQTYGRGMTNVSDLQVWLVVGNVTERAARDQLAAYASDTGPKSVKLALEGGTSAAWDDLHVRSVEFDVITIAGVDYVAAGFTIDLACQGS